MILQYVLDGHEPRPVSDALEWARWFETADRRVARTTLIDGSYVSTVFLGLDHSFTGDGPPVLFETAAFVKTGDEGHLTGWDSVVTDRYCTWAEAELGHMETVERLADAMQAAMQLQHED
jgi:hypothetical protein